MENAETGIVNQMGLSSTKTESRFIERPVAVHYCNGGDITKYLDLVGQYELKRDGSDPETNQGFRCTQTKMPSIKRPSSV